MRVWVAIGFLTVLLLGAFTFNLVSRITAPASPEVTPSLPQVFGLASTPVQKRLRMLSPFFSQTATYGDCVIEVSFDGSYTADGKVESRLPLWLHNTSNSVIAVVWDRCSLQLPNGDTVNILHEDQLGSFGTASSPPTTLAPGGSLVDAVFPVSEVEWTDRGWVVSSGVLDRAPFSFILAIDVGGRIQYYVFRFLIR